MALSSSWYARSRAALPVVFVAPVAECNGPTGAHLAFASVVSHVVRRAPTASSCGVPKLSGGGCNGIAVHDYPPTHRTLCVEGFWVVSTCTTVQCTSCTMHRTVQWCTTRFNELPTLCTIRTYVSVYGTLSRFTVTAPKRHVKFLPIRNKYA